MPRLGVECDPTVNGRRAIADGAVRRISVEERRSRIALRHHLAWSARAGSVVEVASDLVGLHATDPASVFLAAWARLQCPEVGAIEQALYEERSLLKMLGMRRTMFVAPIDLVPVIQAACTQALIPGERRKLVQMLEQAGIASDCSTWLRQVEAATLAAIAARGEAYGGELSRDVPALREQIRYAEDKKWGGSQGISTRVLFLLSAQGQIARGRPRGSWISSQHRWAPMEAWLPGGIAKLTTEVARAELVSRWLLAFGPGTLADLRWWTGWTTGEVRQALAAVGAVEVDLDGGTGFVLAPDVERVPPPEPWVALLPALDPTVMAWTQRRWFLGEHGPALFDRSGNAGPTVWCQGRVAGGWAQRKDGEIVFRLLEDVGADAARAVAAEAGRLASWLGSVRVTPRFRTPLERELSD